MSLVERSISCFAPQCKQILQVRFYVDARKGDELHDLYFERFCAQVGWSRITINVDAVLQTRQTFCSAHTKQLKLECARCRFVDCSCMDGPKLDRVKP
jgi:hypothetical protein